MSAAASPTAPDGRSPVAGGTGEPGDSATVLLAVDVGLRAGLAEFDRQGCLLRYASTHAANRAVLRQAVQAVLRRLPDLQTMVLEGGGPLAEIWAAAAARRGIQVLQTSADTWRQDLLIPRDQRNGRIAKRRADALARDIIEQHGAKRPVSLRSDAAEAILVGVWACRRLGFQSTPY